MLSKLMNTPPDAAADSAAIVPFPLDAGRPEEHDAAGQETQLLIRVRDQRDRGAYQQLFDLFSGKVQGYLRRTGLDPADAENILQDIMLAVWQKARLFDAQRASARTWIFSLARNRLIDLKRSAKRSMPPSSVFIWKPPTTRCTRKTCWPEPPAASPWPCWRTCHRSRPAYF